MTVRLLNVKVKISPSQHQGQFIASVIENPNEITTLESEPPAIENEYQRTFKPTV
jgi:hypothetical protein